MSASAQTKPPRATFPGMTVYLEEAGVDPINRNPALDSAAIRAVQSGVEQALSRWNEMNDNVSAAPGEAKTAAAGILAHVVERTVGDLFARATAAANALADAYETIGEELPPSVAEFSTRPTKRKK